MADDSTENFLGGFVLGAMLGGITTLLLAPRSGRETRRILRDSVDALPHKAEDTLENLQDQADQLVNQTRHSLDEAVERFQEALDAARVASARKRSELDPGAPPPEGADFVPEIESS
ncbi:MAG: YtxH domain-containing protein [Gloeobacterales cyanobacterium]